MKKILPLITLLVGFYGSAQVKGVTEDGNEVILFDNGTWKFVNESDAQTLEKIDENPAVFGRNTDQSILLKSSRLDAGIYYSPKKWEVSAQAVGSHIEYFLRDKNPDNPLFGFMTTEKLQIPDLKSLKNLMLEGIQKNVDYFRLKQSEYRTVNGLKVLYLRYAANVKGLDFEYGIYYYLTASGYCAVVFYCAQNEFVKNSVAAEQFLNGIVKTEKQKPIEIIYTSPPPPMR
ncbi:hypothetical protein [Chryseobacterium sp.]|uniref:hypothetical protein n=1 Tax=Chryseobacterium sp. TaxID=1871047 RepID=UPI0011C7E9F8|nr:hypothetical protein [Chryseobacterium sp.]TXF75113.1 hypothetical protein FUA25_12660 [Chryseobacterium sp.]